MRKFEYENIPRTNKYTLLINSRKINTRSAYEQSLRWIRHMAAKDGQDMDLDDVNNFECIRTMKVVVDHGDDDDGDHHHDDDHELMELQILYWGKSLKLVILRENLQILGFVVPELGTKFQLKTDDYEIEGFTHITGDFTLSYGSRPLKSFGIGPMVKAMYGLIEANPNPSTIAESLEVFYIHFMEAARFRVLDIQIARTMRISNVPFLPERDYNDIRRWVEERYETNVDGFVVLPDFIRHILINFDHISTVWCIYVLSGKKYWTLNESLARNCHIGGPDSVAAIISLVKPNAESVKKVLGELSKDDYEKAEEILELL